MEIPLDVLPVGARPVSWVLKFSAGFGNESRTDASLRNIGINNWDVALSKTTSFSERMKLRFETGG